MQNKTTNPTSSSGLSVRFSGSIAEVYEEVLGAFLFEPYAADLAQRIGQHHPAAVLELACGTGRLTQKILQQLPPSAKLTATDLEADMLKVAKEHIHYPNVDWATADMTNIPYNDNQFDLVVCQFGLMLVPDKLKALSEMYRVLKPGGQLLFSVWGLLKDNPIWRMGGEVVNRFLGINPIAQDPGPFSMKQEETLVWLKGTGFAHASVDTVKQTGTIATAAMAASGFINGLPVHLAIRKKDPALLPAIEQALETELISQLGNHPLQSPLSAWVFEAVK